MASTPSQAKPEAPVTHLVQIFPEAGQRQCNNPACSKKMGGGKGSWMRCSACLSVGYCSQSCQKAHWAVHKPKCKNSVEKKKQEALEGRAEMSEQQRLVGAYLEAWTRLTQDIVNIAARSALRLDREDSLVDTHALEVLLEWQGSPPQVDLRNATEILERFRLVSVTSVRADTNPGMLISFSEVREEFKAVHGFVIIRKVRDVTGEPIGGVEDAMAELPYGLHTWIFRKAFQRPIAVDVNWEATIKRNHDPKLSVWTESRDARYVHFIGQDIKSNEGIQSCVEFHKYWMKNRHISGWPPREV